MRGWIGLAALAFGCGGDDAVGVALQPDSAADAAVDVAQLDAAVDAALPDVGCADCRYEGAVQVRGGQTLTGLLFPRGVGERRLPMLVRYSPNAPEPLPVILWAHGGGFNDMGHTLAKNWSEVLVGAGYAVVHWANVKPDADQLAALCALVELPDEAPCEDANLDREDGRPDANPFSSAAVTRPGDPAAILAEMDALGARIEENIGLDLALDRVGVGGWSGGSQSAVGVAGAVRIVAEAIPPWGAAHPLPRAFVAVSP